jgi:sRNA-binding regulator protein Hfq
MLKKCFTLGLSVVLLHAASTMPSFALEQTRESDRRVEKIKANVAKRGTGEKARVTVELRDGSKLKGHISQAGEDSFTLIEDKSGQTKVLAYSDVDRVKGRGGLSLAAKIGIGVAIFFGSLAILYGVACGDDPFC